MKIIIPVTRNPDVDLQQGWPEGDTREAALNHLNYKTLSELAEYFPEFTFGPATLEQG